MLINDGINEVDRGNLGVSVQKFSQALASGDHEQRVHALNNLGVVYQRLGDHDKALAFYTLAVRMSHLARIDLVQMGAPVPPPDLVLISTNNNDFGVALLLGMQGPAAAQRNMDCVSRPGAGNSIRTNCN